MADQKKKKLCKLKSTEEFSAVRKQPAVIHTSKLLEMLNWKKRSLCKKLSHNDELQATSEEDNREIDPTKYFLEGPITREKNSLRVYAAPVKAATNSLASKSSRSFRKMIVRDDSPELEEIDALVDSPEVEMQSAAATNPRECLRNTIENELFSEVIPSHKKGPSFIGSLDNDYRSIVRERHDSPTNGKRKSLRLDTIRGNSSEVDEPRAAGNVEPPEKDPKVAYVDSMEEPQRPKRKRGLTKLKNVATETSDRIEVQFNSMGQAVGDGSVSLSSFLGPLVREIVPVTIADWRKISKGMMEVLWKSVQVRYKLQKDWEKAYVFKVMANLWRASKSRLVKKIVEAPNDAERLKLRPDNIKSEVDWKAFVREKLSADFKAKSEKFKAMKKKQLPYTGSRKGYARLIDDMSKASANKKRPSRVAVWTKAHTKKNGEPVSIAVGEAIEKMEEYHKELPLSSQTNVKEDAVSKVLGPEKSGRLRAYGEGVTITKLAIVSERDELIIQLEKECRELKGQVATQQGLINTLLKNQGSSCQTERQSNAPMPFTMSVNTNSQSKECKIMDWTGSDEIVAEGRWSSSDPTALVHHIPIGPNAVRVWVDVVRNPNALLWRPNSEMLHIEDAIGSTIAWPIDKIIRT